MNLIFRFLISDSTEKLKYASDLTLTYFSLVDLCILLLYFYCFRKVIVVFFFDIAVAYLEILFLKLLLNHSVTTEFSSLCVKWIWIYHYISSIYCKTHFLYQSIFCFVYNSSKLTWNDLVNSPYIFTKKISTHKEDQTSSLDLIKTFISARLARQMLAIED